LKEDEIIQLFAKPSHPMLDDCHLFDRNKLLTTDSLSEGTHFRLDWSSPEDIAIKLIEVNVSDIFSSGGIPKFCLLNLGLSSESSKKPWITEFSNAFRKRLELYGIELVGGDTFSSSLTQLSLTLFGELPALNTAWSRSGAKVGDKIYLTGSLGLSHLGWKILSDPNFRILAEKNLKPSSYENKKESNIENEGIIQEAIRKHLRPESVYAKLNKNLMNYKINSAMDITDGLFQDSWKLAKASGKTIQINIDKLTRLGEFLKFMSLDEILGSGEELELLFTSSELLPEKLNAYPIAEIGSVLSTSDKPKVAFTYQDEIYLPKSVGYSHF